MFTRITTVAAAILAISASIATADEIRISGGSTSITTVINPVKPAFEKTSGHTINAVAAGSKTALLKLDAGDVEVATAAHSPEELFGVIEKEKIQLKNRDNLKVVQLADATSYAVIVNPVNPVTTISREQLNGIFTGKISNWREVGGKDLPVNVVWGKETQGQNIQFTRIALDGEPVTAQAHQASDYRNISKMVSELPGGIGVMPLEITSAVTRSLDTVLITSPIYVITRGQPSAKVLQIVDFYKKEYSFLQ